jgi:hypothetical protein
MNGRVLGFGLIGFAVLFGAGLWYAQEYAFYERAEGVITVRIDGVDVPVEDYEGIDGTSSPLKLRGCFRVDPDFVVGPVSDDPAPTIAPRWFDCFDAAAIGAALERGQARAVIAQQDQPGVFRIVAVFPDGRAYQWRQIIQE